MSAAAIDYSPKVKKRVKAIMKKLNSTKSPKKGVKIWKSLSKKDRSLVKKELKGKTKVHTYPVGGAKPNPNGFGTNGESQSKCWSLGVEADHNGAVTGTQYFRTTQVTRICVSGTYVNSVDVTHASQEVLGWRPALHTAGFTTGTFNANWEGRGLNKSVYGLGWGDTNVLTYTECAQLRLNGDLKNKAASSSCSIM